MKRATNKCEWLLRSRKENCGKPCVGEYCKQHNYQLNKGGKLPTPCRVCGVGVFCDSGICISCGGGALKKRLFRQRKKAKKAFDLVLRELKAVQAGKYVRRGSGTEYKPRWLLDAAQDVVFWPKINARTSQKPMCVAQERQESPVWVTIAVNTTISKGGKMPTPCRVCGVGL